MKDTKSGTTVNVSAVHKRGPGNKRGAHKPLSNSKPVCFRCGRSPPHDRQQCPAKDVVCHKCSKRGHFKAMCKTNKRIGGVHEEPQTTGTNEYDSDECFLGVVGTDGSNPWQVILQLNGTPTEFQIDTGAKASIISEQIYKDIGSPSLLQHRCLGGQTRVSFPLWDNLQETQEQQYRSRARDFCSQASAQIPTGTTCNRSTQTGATYKKCRYKAAGPSRAIFKSL